MKGSIHRLAQPWLVLTLVILLSVSLAGAAWGAEFGGDEDVYRLPSGQVIEDDLYVGAGEIYIDGTVEGDLFAAGGYIEINGVVTGDLVAAGAGIVVNGEVQDDVRVAGAGIDIAGVVGDDLFAAGGGGDGFAYPIQMGSRSVTQGVRVSRDSRIGGDAVIFGGTGDIDGQIAGDLRAAMGAVNVLGIIGGDAHINAGELRIAESSKIAGQLEYSTPEEANIPGGVAGAIRYEPPQDEVEQVSVVASLVGWLVRTVLILLGFVAVGWLLLRFAPGSVTKPANALRDQLMESSLWGVLATVLLIFAIGLISVVVGIFWGVFPAIVTGMFLFGGVILLWVFSPLVTGFWLGRQITERMGGNLGVTAALLLGVLLIVVLGRLPVLGFLIYLLSFVLTLGALLRMNRPQTTQPAPAAAGDVPSLPVGV